MPTFGSFLYAGIVRTDFIVSVSDCDGRNLDVQQCLESYTHNGLRNLLMFPKFQTALCGFCPRKTKIHFHIPAVGFMCTVVPHDIDLIFGKGLMSVGFAKVQHSGYLTRLVEGSVR